jgi:hypothetical protein
MNKSYYTPYFCEENIWKLGQSIKEDLFSDFKVLFLTNPDKSIALLNQKAVPEDEFVIWDYHVILHDTKNRLIFDFDTRLNFQTDIEVYFPETFLDQRILPENLRCSIRVISLTTYLKHFYSDRSHMLKEGKPIQELPKWPAIKKKPPLSLQYLWDLKHTEFIEETVTAEEYMQRFM